MRVYGAADFVVGLDVDKDAYDKFNVRHEIDLLLLELWRDSHCRDCIRQQATAGGLGAAAGVRGSGRMSHIHNTGSVLESCPALQKPFVHSSRWCCATGILNPAAVQAAAGLHPMIVVPAVALPTMCLQVAGLCLRTLCLLCSTTSSTCSRTAWSAWPTSTRLNAPRQTPRCVGVWGGGGGVGVGEGGEIQPLLLAFTVLCMPHP
jgi:hypothetical protein